MTFNAAISACEGAGKWQARFGLQGLLPLGPLVPKPEDSGFLKVDVFRAVEL